MKILNIKENQIQIDKELYTLLKASTCKDQTRQYITKPFYIPELNKICATNKRVLTLTEELPEPLPPQFLYFDLIKIDKKFILIPATLNGTPPAIGRVLPVKQDLIPYKPEGEEEEYFFKIPKNPTQYATTIFKLFNFLQFPLNLDFLKPLKGSQLFKLSHEDYKVQLDFNSGVLYLMMGIEIKE